MALPVLVLAGCARESGPPTTRTSSQQFPGLADRVRFLERYVRFRRTYARLDFVVVFQNNSSGLAPGPSDWDIQIVATVPEAELGDWTRGTVPEATPDLGWLSDHPGAGAARGVSSWFKRKGTLVGVDRSRAVIAYRNRSR